MRPRPRSARRRGALEPLRHRPFTACWITGTLAHSANWMQTIAVPFIVFEITGSATWLGAAALANQAPALVAAPLAGILSDRYSRKRILILTTLVKAVAALGLYALWLFDELTPWRILGLLLVAGFGSSMNITCWASFVAQIVPPRSLPAAIRLNSMQFNFSRALGPALAGWVLAQYGAGAAFLANALAYFPFVVTVALVRPRPVESAAPLGPLRELREGIDYVLRYRALWVPVLTVGVVSLFGHGLHPLAAGLASDVFGVGEQGFGWLMSSVGMASLASSLFIVLLADRVTRSGWATAGLFVYALGVVAISSTDVYAVGLAGYAITGVAHVMVNISCSTAIQVQTNDALRGRVVSLYLTAIIALIPVGAQVGGLVGDWLGLRSVVFAYGLGLLAYGLFARGRLDRLRALDGDRGLPR